MSKALILVLISALLSAIQYPIMKLALEPMALIGGVLLEVFLVVLFSAIFLKLRKKKINFKMNHSILLIGFINAAGIGFMMYSLQTLNPAIVSYLARTYFVYSLILGILFFNERLNLSQFVTSGVLLVGIAMISHTDSVSFLSLSVLAPLAYPLLFALQNALIKKNFKNVDTYQTLFSMNLVSLIILLLYTFSFADFKHLTMGFDLKSLSLLAIATFAGAFLSQALFLISMKNLEFSLANLMRSSQLVFVILVTIPFYPMDMSYRKIGGVFLVLFSLVILPVLTHLKKKSMNRQIEIIEGVES